MTHAVLKSARFSLLLNSAGEVFLLKSSEFRAKDDVNARVQRPKAAKTRINEEEQIPSRSNKEIISKEKEC